MLSSRRARPSPISAKCMQGRPSARFYGARKNVDQVRRIPLTSTHPYLFLQLIEKAKQCPAKLPKKRSRALSRGCEMVCVRTGKAHCGRDGSSSSLSTAGGFGSSKRKVFGKDISEARTSRHKLYAWLLLECVEGPLAKKYDLDSYCWLYKIFFPCSPLSESS